MPGPPSEDVPGDDADTGPLRPADDPEPSDEPADEGGSTSAFGVAGEPGSTAAFPVADAAPDATTAASPTATTATAGRPVWRIAGRYRVADRIGAGGMADVMRAHDELLDRDVAIKIFRSTPPTPDTASGVERQHAELKALARLNHPNLTMLFDGSIVGQDGPAYLVMELIDGPSLAQVIEAGGLPESQTREIGAQISDALAYVHAAGMVHRDVKPANILLGNDRIVASESVRARLTDFGIVRLVGDEPVTRADMTLGSASYLAPEQARGSAVGPPADVYALGLSLIEALSGRRSFEGPALEAVMARLANDPEIPPGLPQPWPGLLHAMTARDPNQRPTAHQVAAALRDGTAATVALGAAGGALGPAAALAAAGTTAFLARDTGARTAGQAPLPPPMPPVRPPRDDRPPPLPYDPPPSRMRGWLIAAGVIVLLLILGAVLAAALSGGGSGGGGAPSTTPSTSHKATHSSSATHHHSTSAAPSTHSHSHSSAPTTPTPTPSTSASTTKPTPSKTRTSSTHTTKPSTPTTSHTTTPAAAGGGAASSTAASTSPAPHR